MAPPPPPAPPLCFPSFSSNAKRGNMTRAQTEKIPRQANRDLGGAKLVRSGSYSPTATLNTGEDGSDYDDENEADEKLTFVSDTEVYSNLPALPNGKRAPKHKKGASEQITKDTSKKTWGWGSKPTGLKEEESVHEVQLRRASSNISVESDTVPLPRPPILGGSPSPSRNSSKSSKTNPSPLIRMSSSKRPNLLSNDSTSTLVGSAYERKINYVDSILDRPDTSSRLNEIRKLMLKDALDYYVVPSEDAHGSEYIAASDKRRQWISGFTGSVGHAIISKTTAYLITDSRYWLQAEEEADPGNWHVIRAGDVGAPKDWMEWITDRAVRDTRIGIDARMISQEMAIKLSASLGAKQAKLIYPTQNFVDLVWKTKPARSQDPIWVHGTEFAGMSAADKLIEVRNWIKKTPPAVPSYSKSPATPAQKHVGTLITSLSAIAYVLNLRGQDIPFNPLFQAYLFITQTRCILFVDAVKVDLSVSSYLKTLNVEKQEYNNVWAFLRRREWGEGKILISPKTSYAISLMLTHFRYTVALSIIDEMQSIKNLTEIEGMRRAFIRDGASFVRFLAWLENKMLQGYEITEWEAAHYLTEFRRTNKHYWGLAYENISASGPNAALPHYRPTKAKSRIIDRESPYLNDSGGQYRDGTCDTTRTVHFGRPTPEQMEAYTRVLQGHIAIDMAVFPEGTSGRQLDVLARKQLWKDGLNYMHGTGHGLGSFLNVHEGPHSFSSDVPLVPGHIITNEPGFYAPGEWGMRIESALAVSRTTTKNEFNGDVWLKFERLTCVPIQTKMVKDTMLTKEEKAWLKDHNQLCRKKLEPLLADDKRALKWLRREADRGIGIANAGPGGFAIDWD